MPREIELQPHALVLFAVALERDAASIASTPAAASALRDFIRDLKDFAALDDRHVRERIGWAHATVHASVDLQRDLDEDREAAGEVAAAAGDLLSRWKALDEQLDDAQRTRVQSLYGAALMDAAKLASQRAAPR
ncbi:MAG TPA: hypothetical protein VHA82_13755 [Ramlibacter sp.]|uniref:hypothetical protein n=1 Tax=Ramlibacter sp. TaxID=1917967 RepID=UPI002BBA2BC0|nr:hypothetical protein [Ramlibacter sp.]HVZ44871.1 hypothetical protein [Ramlibacter sp.]